MSQPSVVALALALVGMAGASSGAVPAGWPLKPWVGTANDIDLVLNSTAGGTEGSVIANGGEKIWPPFVRGPF